MNAERETSNEPETTSNQGETASNQRDEHGHFRKGNRGGPGNPFARQIARLRKVLLDAVSEADLVNVIEMLKAKAMEGDVAAAKLLLSYTIGKPVDPPNPDTLDLDEFGILVKNHDVPPETFTALLNAMPVDLLLKVVRPILPFLFDSKQAKTRELLFAPQEDGEQETEEEDDDDDDDDDEAEDDPRGSEYLTPRRGSEEPVRDVPTWMEDLISADAQQAEGTVPTKLPPSLKDRLDRQPEPRPKTVGAPMANGSNGKQKSPCHGGNGKPAPSPNRSNGTLTA